MLATSHITTDRTLVRSGIPSELRGLVAIAVRIYITAELRIYFCLRSSFKQTTVPDGPPLPLEKKFQKPSSNETNNLFLNNRGRLFVEYDEGSNTYAVRSVSPLIPAVCRAHT